MYFEARELKEYAEPVSPDEIVEGEKYFSILYADADENLLFPIMKTLVFIGKNLKKGDQNLLYFQDINSYFEGKRFGDTVGENGPKFRIFPEGHTKHIFNFEFALEQLMACSLRRRNAGFSQ